MIAIPWRYTGKNEFIVALILDQSNIDRLTKHDPAVFELGELPAPWNKMECKSIRIMFATDAEIAELLRVGQSQDLPALSKLLKKLERGWTYRPDLGDGQEPFSDVLNQ